MDSEKSDGQKNLTAGAKVQEGTSVFWENATCFLEGQDMLNIGKVIRMERIMSCNTGKILIASMDHRVPPGPIKENL